MNTIVWKPKHPEQSQMWRFMNSIATTCHLPIKNYPALHQWSIDHPNQFWEQLCLFLKVQFDKPAKKTLNQPKGMMNAEWFSGAYFNFSQKLLSRQDDHLALLCIDEEGQRKTISYKQLYHEVARCIAGLKALDVKKGDRIAAVMPNTAYTVVAMLATTALGAIWSSCSPDFGAQAIVDRIGQIEPKILFICDGHQYQGKKHSAQEKITQLHALVPSLKKVVICPNTHESIDMEALPKAINWQPFLQESTVCEFVSLPFHHPVYILFSSGTTGKPKCIVHGAGGTLLQHLKELSLHADLQQQDNLLFYTTCGWMMWNWMISTLALGATLTLYEGSPTYPTPLRLFQVIEKEQITVLGTSAKYFSAIEKAGVLPKHECHLSSLRLILSTGSPLLPQHYDFVYQHIQPDVQLSSISGGTDIISCFALGNPLLPVYKGELQCLGLGMAVRVFNEQGHAVEKERGELVCTQAFPSMPIGFWHDKEQKAYKKAYFERFPGVWAQGDFAEITAHQGLVIYGRSDTVLNPGGVRIGTAEIYRQVEKVKEVMDSIVIGQNWEQDVRVVLFVKLREGLSLNETLCNTIKQTIRQNASPRHVPAKILQVKDIPRTMSGKTVELAVREVVHDQPVNNLQSLANPEALEYFKNRQELKY